MWRQIAIGLVCGSLAACAVPNPVAPPGDLRADREACNRAYPPRIGNYLQHAECVNAAVERDAIPFARHPDLVRLQEQLRAKYSAAVDRRAMTERAGERKMREADELVATAMRERDAGRAAVSDHDINRLEAMMQQ